jgi:hypothetical protein
VGEVGCGVTREKLRRAKEDLYARHALRIVRALKTGELDPLGYLILKFLVDEIEAPGRSGETIITLEELARLIGWPHSAEWLRQKLHALQDAGWIDFDEPRRARNAAWTFRLVRAAIDGQTHEPPTVLQLETPSELEVTSNSAQAEDPSSPQPESVSEESEPPSDSSLEQSRAKTEIENRCSEETKIDHVVRKTTAAEPDPFLAAYERLERNGAGPPVRVEQADDGSLVWTGEPQDGEQGLLNDLQALVDAGLGEWIEHDAQGKP